MTSVKVFYIFIVSVISGVSQAQQASVKLVNVNAHYNEGAVIADLEFNSNIEENLVDIDFINQTIQLDIHGTSIDGNKPIKKTLYSSGA